jgi:hypothetical protein
MTYETYKRIKAEKEAEAKKAAEAKKEVEAKKGAEAEQKALKEALEIMRSAITEALSGFGDWCLEIDFEKRLVRAMKYARRREDEMNVEFEIDTEKYLETAIKLIKENTQRFILDYVEQLESIKDDNWTDAKYYGERIDKLYETEEMLDNYSVRRLAEISDHGNYRAVYACLAERDTDGKNGRFTTKIPVCDILHEVFCTIANDIESGKTHAKLA